MQRSHGAPRGVSPTNSVASSAVSELSALTRSRFSAVTPADSPTETPLPQPAFDGEQQPSHPLASSTATELADPQTPDAARGARTSCPAMTSTSDSNYSNCSDTRSASPGGRGAVQSQLSFMECTSTSTLVAAAGSVAVCSRAEQLTGAGGRPRTRTSSSCNAIGIDGGVLLADSSVGSSSGATGPALSTLRERARNNSEPALFALLTSSTQASTPPSLPIVQQPRSIASATNATAAIVSSD